MSVLFIHETFLGYKLETFTNCNEVKHIMIMIITIIYIFLSSEIFGQQLKITFRKSSVPSPPEKIPPKHSKSASQPLFDNVENVLAPSLSPHPSTSAERGGRTLCNSYIEELE